MRLSKFISKHFLKYPVETVLPEYTFENINIGVKGIAYQKDK